MIEVVIYKQTDHHLPLIFCPSSNGEAVGACDMRAMNCVNSDCSLSHDLSCSKNWTTNRAKPVSEPV
jgi:hypothetical protein